MWILCNGISAWKKRVARESYNFTFVYALIYLLLTLVKRIPCPLDWNNGLSKGKKGVANFHKSRGKSFRFWSYKECDQMRISTMLNNISFSLLLNRGRHVCADDNFSEFGIFRFFFFFTAFHIDLPSVRRARVSADERERKEAGGGSLFSIYRGQRYR